MEKAFPLEVYGGGPPVREELEQEWWLAALQEPGALFRPYDNPEWPHTTLPAFEAVWGARQMLPSAARALDLRIRRAFFAESANLGDRSLYPRLAGLIGLDQDEFIRLFESGAALEAVLAEGREGKERYGVRGTPTLMTSTGKKLRHPIAYPHMEGGRIVSVKPLPCAGDECYLMTRALFEEALKEGGK